MSCRELEADVVDLARGAEMSAASAARLGEHLEQCAGCASGTLVEMLAQARFGLDAHAGLSGQIHDVGLVLPATHAHHLA